MPDNAADGWISASWPVPARVRALTTTRGVPPSGQQKAAGDGAANSGSAMRQTRYAAWRAGPPLGTLADNPDLLRAATVGEAGHLQWLTQVHGKRCIRADLDTCATAPEADAVWTSEPNLGLVIKTADCVPVVIARRDGTRIGAAHGGWRGLIGGVVEQLIEAMDFESPRRTRQPPKTVGSIIGRDQIERIAANQDPWRNLRPEPDTPGTPDGGTSSDSSLEAVGAQPRGQAGLIFPCDLTAQFMEGGAGTPLVAWIGPAIGPAAYEIGEDVHAAVLALTGRLSASNLMELSDQPGKWFLDLFSLAEWLLRRAGVEEISCQRICTYSNPNLHSYRRDGIAAGRLATVVWKTQ